MVRQKLTLTRRQYLLAGLIFSTVLILCAFATDFVGAASSTATITSTLEKTRSGGDPALEPSPTPTPEVLHKLVGSYYLTNENIKI